MNKPTKILAIRNELRAVLGETVSSVEILECARLILDRLDDQAPMDPSFRDARATIEQTPLFEVFELKCWQLLCRESMEVREPDSFMAANDYLCEQLGMTDLRMCA